MKYSEGQYYLRVPKERKRNLRFRKFILRRCREDTRFRKAVLKMCKEDFFFFVNTFVWQFNPNAIGKGSPTVGPFITWDYQEPAVRTILDCIANKSDLVIEKSREMGASWLCIIVMIWFFLFHPNSVFMCISRNENMVDSPKFDSLFWKMRYILNHLPEWLTPAISTRVMSLTNDEIGCQINGYATTGDAGVSGRATAIFIDEFALIAKDWELLEHTASTSGCRIFNSTHRGTNTAFYELTLKGSDPNFRHCQKIVMHWSQHPDKNQGLYYFDRETQQVVYTDPLFVYEDTFTPVTDGSPTGGPYPGLRSPWYDMMCPKMGTARGIASDLDINPSGSLEQVFDGIMINDLVSLFAKDPYHKCDLAWDRASATPTRLYDERDGKLWLWQRLSHEGLPPKDWYVLGLDIATGTGATPSCLSIASLVTGEKIGEYVDAKIEPKDLAYYAVALARLFKNPDGGPAKLIWETPGPGNTFGKHVLALGHFNVYLRRTDHRMKKEVSDTPGWPNAPDSMKALIAEYKDALRGKYFLNHSKFALLECLAFVYGDDGYVWHTGWKDPRDNSGARINHGDRVVADALCWKMVDESGKRIETDVFSDRTMDGKVIPPAHKIGTLAWRREIARVQGSKTKWG